MGIEAAIIGGSILNAGASVIGSGRAADAMEDSSQAAIDEQRRQFNEVLRLTAPQREFGDQSINELSRLFGFGGEPDLDVFQESPDFRFRQEEGLEGIAQTLGAGGAGAFSGNALRELNRFNSNLASGEFGDFVNRRLDAAGLGQASTAQAGQGAITTGLSVGNQLQNQGNARASGILGQTAAGGNLVKDLVDALVAGRRSQQLAIDAELLPLFEDQGLF